MKKCEVCGTLIVFGPVRSGEHIYCSYVCRDEGDFEEETAIVSNGEAEEMALALNLGECPKCDGPGPVDMQYSYTVWSVFVLTSYKTISEVCCGTCGRKSKLKAALFSLGLGWWGLPFGLLITPVQIARNLFGMLCGPVAGSPSPELEPVAKLLLADHYHQQEIEEFDEADENDKTSTHDSFDFYKATEKTIDDGPMFDR